MPRLSTYNLTSDDYEAMLEACDYSCQICGVKSEKSLHIDHDHSRPDAPPRGILCAACNHAIGLFRDDPEILARAIEYLALAKRSQVKVTCTSAESSTSK
jgi:hypothetical protein